MFYALHLLGICFMLDLFFQFLLTGSSLLFSGETQGKEA
jgi:hypothetical protein